MYLHSDSCYKITCYNMTQLISADLEHSQQVAVDLEERMRNQEIERKELEAAQKRAEAARIEAERAAHMEKEEREKKVH